MPNAARLVAALGLGLIGFIVSGQIMPLLPEGTYFGWFTHVNVALGVICGWVVMGKRAGGGISDALTNGLTGIAVLVFWALFVQGTYEMVQLAMRRRYGGPFEAIKAIFEIGLDYGQLLVQVNILVTLLVGGVLVGLATEFAARRWR
jgi:hypothetical protein